MTTTLSRLLEPPSDAPLKCTPNGQLDKKCQETTVSAIACVCNAPRCSGYDERHRLPNNRATGLLLSLGNTGMVYFQEAVSENFPLPPPAYSHNSANQLHTHHIGIVKTCRKPCIHLSRIKPISYIYHNNHRTTNMGNCLGRERNENKELERQRPRSPREERMSSLPIMVNQHSNLMIPSPELSIGKSATDDHEREQEMLRQIISFTARHLIDVSSVPTVTYKDLIAMEKSYGSLHKTIIVPVESCSLFSLPKTSQHHRDETPHNPDIQTELDMVSKLCDSLLTAAVLPIKGSGKIVELDPFSFNLSHDPASKHISQSMNSPHEHRQLKRKVEKADLDADIWQQLRNETFTTQQLQEKMFSEMSQIQSRDEQLRGWISKELQALEAIILHATHLFTQKTSQHGDPSDALYLELLLQERRIIERQLSETKSA
ncbi:hypothetical protein PROFUN_02111 [Planoprotostelium fungivorum]|uniref:Uncharacterized protein n=1 Tax=Planoprotostelium fungivorum TaxID=1890364 RepID=A0A2P6NZ58_9EUKA|nr:hypothetical protein PROFUN_02111 [Planoprotostelium fungivorum]